MYLLAKAIIPSNLLTNWKGRGGKFLRTFGMNTKRNKNEWRATWDSIKKNIHTALQLPGIEYEICRNNGCDLDHVEADTFEENIAKQKPYERTKIIDYIFDEKNESVDLIHEVHDDEFWKKVQKREIKYVSPLIWPLSNGVKILGRGRAGLPIIDTTRWKFVHHAFLKTEPAYGENTATIKTMCDGKNCDVKLLKGKLLADTIANSENLSHLQETPLLYKHKGNLILLSANPSVQKMIKEKKDAGIKIDDQMLSLIYSKCSDNSFKTCSCTASNKMPTEEQLQKDLNAQTEKVKELEGKLKAQTDKDDEEKSFDAKKAIYAKLFANIDDEKREKMVASLKGDDDELKAATEVDKEIKAKKANTDDSETEKLKARITTLEAEKTESMITDLKSLKAKYGLSEKEVNEYHASLKGKTYTEIKSRHKENESEIIKMKASVSNSDEEFVYKGADVSSLRGKTFDQIAGGIA